MHVIEQILEMCFEVIRSWRAVIWVDIYPWGWLMDFNGWQLMLIGSGLLNAVLRRILWTFEFNGKEVCFLCPSQASILSFVLPFLVYILLWHETEQGFSINHYLDGFWTNVSKLNQVQELSRSEFNLCWALTTCYMLWRKQICKVKLEGKTLNGGEWSDNNNCWKN